jgi:lipopolysaccharide/colanic/teichoic acid biosynthesis glycosyltransferase
MQMTKDNGRKDIMNISALNDGSIISLSISKTVQKRRFFYLLAKRAFDIVFSLLGLVFLSPLYLIIAIMIKLDSDGPVFFKHNRIGLNGSCFKIYKFRSMKKNAVELMKEFTVEQKKKFEENYKLDNDPRVTRIGKFLRESSLDELPQLLNIFQGDLSFVGPRPLVHKELDKYGNQRDRFLSVKPGLTGNWQVNGRCSITYQERMDLELKYVDEASFKFDMVILLKTVPAVFKKIGAK